MPISDPTEQLIECLRLIGGVSDLCEPMECICSFGRIRRQAISRPGANDAVWGSGTASGKILAELTAELNALGESDDAFRLFHDESFVSDPAWDSAKRLARQAMAAIRDARTGGNRDRGPRDAG